MADLEKVKKGLLFHAGTCSNDCPYHESDLCVDELCLDALKLLKEQEAVTEYVMDEYQPTCKACGFRPFAGYIPSLEWMRERGFKFCPQCGKPVKWNDRYNQET